MVYLWLRFEWRFAVSAVASEIHAHLITVGIFALTGREFDLPALAAVLSVVGYSINDKSSCSIACAKSSARRARAALRNPQPFDQLDHVAHDHDRPDHQSRGRYAVFRRRPGAGELRPHHADRYLIGTLSSVFFANPILLWLGVSKQDLMPRTKENRSLRRGSNTYSASRAERRPGLPGLLSVGPREASP